MTSFSASTLEKKLSDLSNTQQSIQTISLWLIHHRKHAKIAVQVWYKQLQKAKSTKKLTYMYLANDVLQNGKRKGPEFNNEFKGIMPSAFRHCAHDGNADALKGLDRLISIWRDRNVYDATVIEKLKKCMSQDSSNDSPPEKKARVEEPTEDSLAPVEAPEPDELIKVLQELENSASQDAVVREKIANLPAEVQDASLLDQVEDKETGERLSKIVDEACLLLAEYNGRLAAELEDRVNLSKMLSAFVQLQKSKQNEAEKRLEEYKSKLEKVTVVRKELKSHLANLPDLSKLPDVHGGLAPLPSAGDLFAIGSGAQRT